MPPSSNDSNQPTSAAVTFDPWQCKPLCVCVCLALYSCGKSIVGKSATWIIKVCQWAEVTTASHFSDDQDFFPTWSYDWVMWPNHVTESCDVTQRWEAMLICAKCWTVAQEAIEEEICSIAHRQRCVIGPLVFLWKLGIAFFLETLEVMTAAQLAEMKSNSTSACDLPDNNSHVTS